MDHIIQQNSYKISGNISIILLTIATVFIITYQFAFQHTVTVKSSILLYSIDLFFIINFFVFQWNFKKKGNKLFNNKFGIDLLSVLPIDIFFIYWSETNIEGISIVLWLRLLRLIRLKYIFSAINSLQYEIRINPGYFRIAKFLVIIIILSHMIGCIWYLSAYFAGFPEQSWIRLYELYKTDSITAYIRSMYWTITTLTTVGYGDITPHTNYEYILSAGVMVSGAFMYAFIIGNIASIISNLDSQKTLFRNKIDSTYLNLHKRGISNQLNTRIRNFYEYIWLNHRGFESYSFLNELPKSLRLEVMHEMTKDMLEQVPIFKQSSHNLKNVLLMSLKAKTYDPGSIVAEIGQKGKKMFFISKGFVEVRKFGDDASMVLKNGDYFGDISLITGETRSARAVAKEFCEIFELHIKEFIKIKNEHPEFREVLKKISSQKSNKTAEMIMDGIVL